MLDLRELSAAIIDGNAGRVKELVLAATDQGVPPEEIVTRWMVPALDEVGARFERHEYYVPEMLVAARAMQAGLALLRPLLARREIKPLAVAAIGTVRGDLHDIGKNLVAMMWEGAGLEVIDLGVDVPAVGTGHRVDLRRAGAVSKLSRADPGGPRVRSDAARAHSTR